MVHDFLKHRTYGSKFNFNPPHLLDDLESYVQLIRHTHSTSKENFEGVRIKMKIQDLMRFSRNGSHRILFLSKMLVTL